ncbi:MAG: protease pro-enzyme activation domain-containing protein, partial [Actinobacteria bacterium]|nr:protease pro-enzyme activation domain-containing protein [Actinomycetota bacterium]
YYHHFLRPGQFETRFGPGAPAIHAVETSLDSAHLHPRLTGSIISIHASAATVESALHTHLERYVLPNGRLVFANLSRPELPASAAKYIQAIVGLSTSPQPQPFGSSQASTPVAQPGTMHTLCSTPAGLFARLPQKSLPVMLKCPPRPAPSPVPSESLPSTAGPSKHAYTISRPLVTGEPAACNAASSLAETSGSYTAGQIAQAYGFTAAYGSGHLGAGETMALYELAPYSAGSVSTFENCYGISTSVTSISVDGGTAAGTGDSTTATLDIEEAASLAPDAGILVYEGPDNTPTGPLDTYNAIAAQDRAQVVSTAWGICESAIPKSYAQAENAIFEQMAAQGQTVFASTGSSGSEGCAKPSNTSSITSSACPFTTTCIAPGSNGTIGIAVGVKDASSTPTLAGTPVDVPGTSTLDAVACPVPASSTTSTTCVAAGTTGSGEGVAVPLGLSPSGTVSAGTPVDVPGTSTLDAVACPVPASSTTSTTCVAAGTTGSGEGVAVPLGLSPSGTVSAGTPVDVPGTSTLDAVACPVPASSTTSTTCVAAGTTGSGEGVAVPLGLSPSGTVSAGTPVDVPGTSTLDAVACPVPASSTTSTTCVAAGYSYVSSTSTEGIVVALGLSPSGTVSAGTPVDVPGLTPLYGIACASSTSCIAAGEAVGYSLEAVGYNLEGVTVPVTLSPDGIVSAGTPVDVSTATSFNTISCASSTSCVAGGYTYVANTTNEEAVAVPVALSSDGTVSAGTPVAVPGLWILYSMACPLSTTSSTICVAAGADTNSTQGAVIPVTLSRSGTPSAGTPVYIPGTISLNSISCPSSTICEAVGETANGEGIVIPVTLSSSGTVSVGTPVDASGTTALNGLICSVSTTCETVGRGTNGDGAIVPVTLSSSGIPSAGTPVDVSGTSSFNDIVCPRQANCVAAGWTRAQATGKEGVITPVTISASGIPSAGTPVDVSGTFSLIGLACPSSAACEAVGEAPGVGVHKGGTAVAITLSSSGIPSAGTPVDISGTSALYNIACTSSTSCVAAGYNYFASTGNYAGTILPITLSSNGVSSMGTLTDISGTSVLYDLACISSATCVVIGETYRYSMESIMVPMTVSPSGIPSTGTPVTVPGLWILDAIACPSSTSSTSAGACVAAGQSAGGEGVAVPVALSSNGTVSAGTPVDVSGTVSLDAITCTSSTSSTSAGTCVAAGQSAGGEGVAVPVALSSNGTVSAGTPVDVSGTVSLDAIACPSSTSSTSAGTCVAAGQSAGGEGVAVPVALSSNGTVSAGTPVDVSGTVSLDAI